MQVFVIINNVEKKINADIKAKNWLKKAVVKKGLFIFILDYENCKCGKKLFDKLVEECTEKVDKIKLVQRTLAEYENMCKCSFTLYIALFSVLLTISIRIGTIFVYWKYMIHD